MVILLGASGYVGQAFFEALRQRGIPTTAPSRRELDYTQFGPLTYLVKIARPAFLINAAGYTGKPNVDACEDHRADTLQGNTLFPAMVAHVCAQAGVPLGHVSSGCIYSGAKIAGPGGVRVERDLLQPEAQLLLRKNPGAIRGFTETDEPNFTFRQPPCSFYSGAKALAEEAIRDTGQNYIWRLRIPFDQLDNPRNYLSKVQNYPKVYENVNSLSHRGDFVRACLDLWQKQAPFGIYNVTNPGFITTREVVGLIEKILKPGRAFEFWAGDREFYEKAAKTPRSNCVLDTAKIASAGVQMRPVHDAIIDSLEKWTPLK
jgi:dTDP-4-dehydrorhamnose reductase